MLKSMRWGIPLKSSNQSPGAPKQVINARDDSVAKGSPMWSRLRNTKRCVVLAQGFYEWQQANGKQTFYMTPKPRLIKSDEIVDDGLLWMAGLYDTINDVGRICFTSLLN